ncbi:MAG: patatin-like phospholipase family protein [Verrucomicrobiia bacterium]
MNPYQDDIGRILVSAQRIALSYYCRVNKLTQPLFLFLLIILLLCGCAARRPLMGTSIARQFENALQSPNVIVYPPELPEVRAWGNQKNDAFQKSMLDSFDQELQSGEMTKEINVLALSGGGDDGAYGAGFLCGLHHQNKLPRFKLVTGISTGAMIAPFAFVGDDCCFQILSNLYTQIKPVQIFKFKSPFKLFRTDSVADTRPLQKMIERYVDEELVRKIALEHQKGRRLYIQTTSLDAQRPVIWDIGAIATNVVSDNMDTPVSKSKIQLIRNIMLASAAIPVFFPPVYINSRFSTNTSNSISQTNTIAPVFPEMHVDGGVANQIFVTGGVLDLQEIKKRIDRDNRQLNVYVIRNGRLHPEPKLVYPTLVKIATRSSTTITKYDAAADIFRIATLVQTLGGNFHLQFIPSDFKKESKRMFDTEYMRTLFMLGCQQANSQKPWLDKLPEEFHYGLYSEKFKKDASESGTRKN